MPTKSKNSSGVDGLLKKAAQKTVAPREPVWTGPAGTGPNGGVTQGLLGRYLSCKERFRVRYVEGWVPAPRFEPRIEYGSMWHCCEEALAAGESVDRPAFFNRLEKYHRELGRRFPLARDEIGEWAAKVYQFFPRYTKFWAEHPDVKDRTPLLQETAFDVPYRLPSSRTVRLRGKWDAVDLIGKGKDAGVYVQENKTKSAVDGVKIARHCTFDLQTMLYLVAIEEFRAGMRGELQKTLASGKNTYVERYKSLDEPAQDVLFEAMIHTRGVRYNVVRRPAHKTVESAVKKFEEDERNGRIGEWFGRWKVEVSPADLAKFRNTFLDLVLENLCDDYEWWAGCHKNGSDVWNSVHRLQECPYHRPRHFRYPFGVYSPLEENGGTDLDSFLDNGSVVGLERTKQLFPELV